MVKTCKVVILGGEGCGKTSLVLRYVQARYTDVYDPHVVDVYKREDSVLGESVVFTIVDVCGGDGFESLRMEKCAEADAFVFVADASSADSIDAVFSVRQALVLEAALKPSILAVAKCDIAADDVLERAAAEAAKVGMDVVQTSSKRDTGVRKVFRHVAALVSTPRRRRQCRGDSCGPVARGRSGTPSRALPTIARCTLPALAPLGRVDVPAFAARSHGRASGGILADVTNRPENVRRVSLIKHSGMRRGNSRRASDAHHAIDPSVQSPPPPPCSLPAIIDL
eukprot:TRINITY_DN1532_c0_g1_i2.p2 TRINITY_DN1532_c0_g1~~TRINITY_DN1532_c0_g1_i2.p2  ORF type:complete len:282 (+),score=62.29 TRINITY_DN1532_c0_g1_i2:102-947(+)